MRGKTASNFFNFLSRQCLKQWWDFFMSVCMSSLLYPFPSRTRLLSPSGLWHRNLLATATAQCSGTTDSSSRVIQHLSEAKLRSPYVLMRCCFLLCRKDTRTGGCCSGAPSLSPKGPVPALLPPDLQKD